MASKIDLNSVNRFRLHKQHLTDESRSEDVVQIARDIYGLHATNPTTPYVSLLARARDFTRDKLDRELYVNKTLGKIRCVRTTVHVLPRETIPIAFAATKSHRRTQFGGLPPVHGRSDGETVQRCVERDPGNPQG